MHAPRLNAARTRSRGLRRLRGVEDYIQRCGLEKPLIDLVKMRASQINGCAFCLDMHSRDARRAGETEQRLYLLNGWREVAAVQRPRAGGAGLDRMPDRDRHARRARCRVRGAAEAVLAQGDRRSHRADRHDQPVEPRGDRDADAASCRGGRQRRAAA